jgi:GMP synthase (glutamine-hydrolysing)
VKLVFIPNSSPTTLQLASFFNMMSAASSFRAGPASVYDDGAPQLPEWLLTSTIPVLGICYGMQLQSYALGGKVVRADQREYGAATITADCQHPLFAGLPTDQAVWMSHGDHIEALPAGFVPLAGNTSTPFAAMRQRRSRLVRHPIPSRSRSFPDGRTILRHFALNICGAQPTWQASSFVSDAIARIKAQVGDGKVICGLSGGVIRPLLRSLSTKPLAKT